MENIFEIHPKRPISGVLPNMKRIMDVTRMPLSKKEFLRCMNSATLYAVVGEDKILVTSLDYDKAMSLFGTHEEYVKAATAKVHEEMAKPIENKPSPSSEPIPVKIIESKADDKKEEDSSTLVKEEKYETVDEKKIDVAESDDGEISEKVVEEVTTEEEKEEATDESDSEEEIKAESEEPEEVKKEAAESSATTEKNDEHNRQQQSRSNNKRNNRRR